VWSVASLEEESEGLLPSTAGAIHSGSTPKVKQYLGFASEISAEHITTEAFAIVMLECKALQTTHKRRL